MPSHVRARSLLRLLRRLAANGGFCTECERFAPEGCARCLARPLLESEVQGIATFHLAAHEGPLAENILRLKYGETPALGFALGGHLGEKLAHQPWPEAPVLVPVPLHDERLYERGYNQSALIARGIATSLGLGYVETRLLLRVKATAKQATLKEDERSSNLSGAFEAQKRAVRGPLWLVDDVCTTGATLTACITALRKRGLEPSGVLTLTCSTSRALRARERARASHEKAKNGHSSEKKQ